LSSAKIRSEVLGRGCNAVEDVIPLKKGMVKKAWRRDRARVKKGNVSTEGFTPEPPRAKKFNQFLQALRQYLKEK
jgi:hypothetical protein